MAAGSPEQQAFGQFFLRMTLALVAQRTVDEDVRARWFRGPAGQRLVELAGSLDGVLLHPAEADGEAHIDQRDAELLKLLMEGLTNHEIAERLGQDETQVARRLGEMFARIGAPGRSEATAFAFREQVV